MTHTRTQHLEISDPLEAIRYLYFRAEHRVGRWFNLHSLGGRVMMSLKMHAEEDDTPTRLELLITGRGQRPTPGDRYLIDKALWKFELQTAAAEEIPDFAVRIWLTPIQKAVGE